MWIFACLATRQGFLRAIWWIRSSFGRIKCWQGARAFWSGGGRWYLFLVVCQQAEGNFVTWWSLFRRWIWSVCWSKGRQQRQDSSWLADISFHQNLCGIASNVLIYSWCKIDWLLCHPKNAFLPFLHHGKEGWSADGGFPSACERLSRRTPLSHSLKFTEIGKQTALGREWEKVMCGRQLFRQVQPGKEGYWLTAKCLKLPYRFWTWIFVSTIT